MHASDIMSRPVISVYGDTPVAEAVVLLTQHGFASLPVVNDDDQVVGIISESDALASGWASDGRTAIVEALMTTPVEVAAPDTDVAELARRILAGRLRSIPIVQHGVLVGVVSRRDLLRPMVRRDDVIESAVQALLNDYAGHRDRWRVSVRAGVASISGEFVDEAERKVVGALAGTVPGVVSADLLTVRSAADRQKVHGTLR